MVLGRDYVFLGATSFDTKELLLSTYLYSRRVNFPLVVVFRHVVSWDLGRKKLLWANFAPQRSIPTYFTLKSTLFACRSRCFLINLGRLFDVEFGGVCKVSFREETENDSVVL